MASEFFKKEVKNVLEGFRRNSKTLQKGFRSFNGFEEVKRVSVEFNGRLRGSGGSIFLRGSKAFQESSVDFREIQRASV